MEFIKNIKSKLVIKSTSGGEAGSIVKLEFDDDSFLFIYCTWRLEREENVLVTSTDSIDFPNGLITEKIKLLKNNKIVDINISPQYDLDLLFENSFKLKIFCDISYSSDESYDLNWELCVPNKDKIIGINNKFSVVETKYND